MKAARTYVLMFVPIPPEWMAPAAVSRGFTVGRNGNSSSDHKNNRRFRWQGRDLEEWEAQLLPSDLFWTWFIDNPRPSCS